MHQTVPKLVITKLVVFAVNKTTPTRTVHLKKRFASRGKGAHSTLALSCPYRKKLSKDKRSANTKRIYAATSNTEKPTAMHGECVEWYK